MASMIDEVLCRIEASIFLTLGQCNIPRLHMARKLDSQKQCEPSVTRVRRCVSSLSRVVCALWTTSPHDPASNTFFTTFFLHKQTSVSKWTYNRTVIGTSRQTARPCRCLMSEVCYFIVQDSARRRSNVKPIFGPQFLQTWTFFYWK